MNASVCSLLSLTRRAVLMGGVMWLSLSSPALLRAADEAAPAAQEDTTTLNNDDISCWTVGGKRYGWQPRKDTNAASSRRIWFGYKYWSFYDKGRACYFRPGKDDSIKGDETYWTKDFSLLGKVGNHRIWQWTMDDGGTEDEKKHEVEAPGLMLLIELEDEANGGDADDPGTLSLFFFVAGAKGDKLTCTFDKEKYPAGHVTVTRQPAGKGKSAGVAHTYEFKFVNDVPVLVTPKVKRGK